MYPVIDSASLNIQMKSALRFLYWILQIFVRSELGMIICRGLQEIETDIC